MVHEAPIKKKSKTGSVYQTTGCDSYIVCPILVDLPKLDKIYGTPCPFLDMMVQKCKKIFRLSHSFWISSAHHVSIYIETLNVFLHIPLTALVARKGLEKSWEASHLQEKRRDQFRLEMVQI